MHRLTRHLRKRYLWAASVLLVAISLSVGYAFYVAKMQESDAKVINIAGMQRMLSQKISLHRQLLNVNPSVFDEQQLQASVERFLANHEFLLQADMLKYEEVARLLAPQSELDLKVRAFADEALTGDNMSIFAGPQLVLLLRQLDEVVSKLEQRSQANMVYLEQVLSLLILVAVLIACAEWFFIFKPMSKRLVKILTKLRNQRRVVVRANRIKDDFIANVSHELLTPINGILGLLNPPQDVTLTDIENATYCTRNLHSIVQEMLDLQQLQSGRFSLHNSTQQLATTMRSILAPIELDKRFVSRVTLQGLGTNNVPIYTDHMRLTQVLNQLISNALIHTHQQVIIDVKYSAINEQLVIDVRDFGTGIDVRDLAAAQQNSLHYDNRKVQHFKGVKLGLSLAFAITRLAHGQLQFEHLNNGTLAQLIWPAVEAKNNDIKDYEKGTKSRSALIVDDNKINQMVMRNIIEMLDFTVDVASDGKMAVELAKDSLYDCIFMDINMPNMDGIEATAIIRQQRNSSTPVILVTASQDEQRIKQGLQAGANTAIYKPIEIEQIKAALKKVQLHSEAT